VIAVKPQIVDASCRAIAGRPGNPLPVALAVRPWPAQPPSCGHLAPRRTMPNAGRDRATGSPWPRQPALELDQRQFCDRLLPPIGESAWVEDEALIDSVTAVLGSSHAYVFF